jgi:hypothetical protein
LMRRAMAGGAERSAAEASLMHGGEISRRGRGCRTLSQGPPCRGDRGAISSADCLSSVACAALFFRAVREPGDPSAWGRDAGAGQLESKR